MRLATLAFATIAAGWFYTTVIPLVEHAANTIARLP